MDTVMVIGLPFVLPAIALGLLLVPRLRGAVPWIGLLTVAWGTLPAFSSSYTLMERGGIGVGIGWLWTAYHGLVGLALVVGFVRLRPVRFIPFGCLGAGLLYVASFYAFFPPWGSNPGMLVFLVPGVGLLAFGAVSWRTNVRSREE